MFAYTTYYEWTEAVLVVIVVAYANSYNQTDYIEI